jgi:hypothetical protein
MEMTTPTYDRDTVIREVEHRRKKQWDIFSWCSTLFVAIIGGVIALQVRDPPHPLSWKHQGVLSFAVVDLLVYAGIWISYNNKIERSAVGVLKNELTGVDMQMHPAFGYAPTLCLLAVATLIAIWLPL